MRTLASSAASLATAESWWWKRLTASKHLPSRIWCSAEARATCHGRGKAAAVSGRAHGPAEVALAAHWREAIEQMLLEFPFAGVSTRIIVPQCAPIALLEVHLIKLST